MSTSLPEFQRNAVQPVACLKAGWHLIKDQYWLFLGIAFVGVLVGQAVPLGILIGPMWCGIYYCLLRRMRGEPVTFDMVFRGFDHFKESLIAALIQIVPVLILMTPVYIGLFIFIFSMDRPRGRASGGGLPPDFYAYLTLFIILFLIIFIVSMVIGAFFIFSFPLIIDRRLSGVEAVKTSFRAVMGNLGGVFGLMFLNVLLGFAGVLACYIGAFLVLPISFAAIAVAYRRVFPEPSQAL
jgi:uncharacterized membrane protein